MMHETKSDQWEDSKKVIQTSFPGLDKLQWPQPLADERLRWAHICTIRVVIGMDIEMKKYDHKHANIHELYLTKLLLYIRYHW